jgi:hypothetical protein
MKRFSMRCRRVWIKRPVKQNMQTVLKSMSASGINIVAIHQHMTSESSRILFLHYRGKGKAADLANGAKTALEAQRASRPVGFRTPARCAAATSYCRRDL